MGMKALVTGAMMASLAGGAMAQSLDPVRVEMFRSILKGNECTLTEGAAANILPRFDFTREETRAIVGALVAAGEVRLDGSTLDLVDGSCETEDPVTALLGQPDVQQFIAVMAENSCAMSEADAEIIFSARGISKAQVGAVVGPMIGAGMAVFEGGVLSVDSAYCAAPVVAEASPPVVVGSPVEAPSEMVELDRSGMFGMSRVRVLVDAMAANSCTLNMETPDAFLAEAGIEHGFATFVARKMISDGFASMVDAENMVLAAPYCIPAGGDAVMAQVETAVETPVEAPVETPVEVPTPMMVENDGTPRGIFLSVVAQTGCALDVTAAEAPLAEAGMRLDQAFRVVDDLIMDGKASLSNDGVVVTVDPSICVAGSGQSAAVETPVTPTETPPSEVNYEFPPSPEGVMIAMMRRNSCSMSLSDARAQFPVLGVPVSAFDPLLQEYIQDGKIQASVDGQTLNFVDPMCYPTPGATDLTDERVDGYVADREAASAQMEALLAENQARIVAAMEAQGGEAQVEADPRAGVLAMLAANGCEVTQGNAAELVAAAGLDFNTSMQILTQMMGSGEATSPDGGQTLQVGAPLCVAAGAEPMTPREAFINLIKQNNCSITAAEFSTLLPVDGLDASTAFGMISELEAEGVISLPATRDVVTLSAEMCR